MLWAHRVVVPEKGRKGALQMLHEGHPQMKTFSRGYIWRPGIDKQIESAAKQCIKCHMTRKDATCGAATPVGTTRCAVVQNPYRLCGSF